MYGVYENKIVLFLVGWSLGYFWKGVKVSGADTEIFISRTKNVTVRF